jgi:O-antigen/teichoic acid export membrane protein
MSTEFNEPAVEQVELDTSMGHALATASTRLLDLPSRYGLHLLVAARLPIDEVGSFYIVFSTFTMLSGFGRLGVDRALTREVAAALGRNQPEVARKAIRQAFWVTLLQSGIIAALLALLAQPIAVHVLSKPWLTVPLLFGALTIVPQNLGNTAAGALAGLGRVGISQMIYQWLWPAIFCVVALIIHIDLYRVLELICISMVVSMVVGIALMLRILPVVRTKPKHVEVPPMFGLGMSLFSLEVQQLAVSTVPAFVVGIVASTTDVGRYALAWRIVLMLNLLVSAMGAVASPGFARSSAVGDHKTLHKIAAQTVGLTFAFSGLPAILLAVNPAFFLRMFGPSYAPAAPALRALLIGQTALILCAGVPELLGMAGHAKQLVKVNLISLVVLLIGLAALTRRFTDVGAAASASAAMLVTAIGVSFYAKRELGLIPIVDFYHYFVDRMRARLRPAEASDSPSLSDVQDTPNS